MKISNTWIVLLIFLIVPLLGFSQKKPYKETKVVEKDTLIFLSDAKPGVKIVIDTEQIKKLNRQYGQLITCRSEYKKQKELLKTIIKEAKLLKKENSILKEDSLLQEQLQSFLIETNTSFEKENLQLKKAIGRNKKVRNLVLYIGIPISFGIGVFTTIKVIHKL